MPQPGSARWERLESRLLLTADAVPETVDAALDVGRENSIAVSPQGIVGIAYQDVTSGDLKYAQQSDGNTWAIQLVDRSGWAGQGASLAMTATGQPVISYVSSGQLKYAAYNAKRGRWQYATLDTGGQGAVLDTAICLTSAGSPVVAYSNGTHVRLARHNGAAWGTQEVFAGSGTIPRIAMALDSQGLPHIALTSRRTLYYVTQHMARFRWESTFDGKAQGAHSCVSIAVDSLNHPVIAFHQDQGDVADDAFYWVRKDVPAWTSGYAFRGGMTRDQNCRATAVFMDHAGYPQLLTMNAGGYLDLVRPWTPLYQGGRVDYRPTLGRFISADTGSDGAIHVAYYDQGSGDLLYWRSTGPVARITSRLAPVRQAGGAGSYKFQVEYTDNEGVSGDSLDGHDIVVTGPQGASLPVALFSTLSPSEGTPYFGTYRVAAPGGAWDRGDNGAYTITLQADQVFDGTGQSARQKVLGSFTVAI